MKDDDNGKTLIAYGILNKYADSSKMSEEKSAWLKAAVKKYRDNLADSQHADNPETHY